MSEDTFKDSGEVVVPEWKFFSSIAAWKCPNGCESYELEPINRKHYPGCELYLISDLKAQLARQQTALDAAEKALEKVRPFADSWTSAADVGTPIRGIPKLIYSALRIVRQAKEK